MKQWKTPQITNLDVSKTMEQGWGEKWICTECCKTSNYDRNQNNAEHFHKGFCSHHPKNHKNGWEYSLATVVKNTGDVVCKAHS